MPAEAEMAPDPDTNRPLREGVSRRDLFQRAALSTFGVALGGQAQANPIAAGPTGSGFGKAERYILLYLWGPPSRLETFDPQPDSLLEVRGEFGTIATSIPGIRVGEILPRFGRPYAIGGAGVVQHEPFG